MSGTKRISPLVEWIGSRFESFQRNGNGWKALCPGHDDNKRSLSIQEGEDGRVLVKCHAGCKTDHLLDVVGLTTKDLMPGAERIVATYDYRNESGELLFQVLRYLPKDFRQRRPNSEGGWIYSTAGVQRVLYRLQELQKSNKTATVFIVEGERDVDNLIALGIVATCNAGGAGKWAADFNQHLRGRRVVIIPDNDQPGRDHGAKVADQLVGIAASVRILELPGLPDKGDVSDWLGAGHTTAELGQLARQAKPITQRANRYPLGTDQPDPSGIKKDCNTSHPSPPNPLGNDPLAPDGLAGSPLGKCPVAPFPVEVLPGVLREFVESVAAALPCPVDYPGAMILPVLSTFIGRQRCIRIKDSWCEYGTLWVAVVGKSGDRKTPAFEKATEPLRIKQQEWYAEYLKEKEEWENKGCAGPQPRLKQILTTDTTIEALKLVLASNPTGVCYPADELSQWARSIGQYKGGRGDDRQIWLSIWSGTQIVSNRVSRPEPIVINDPFVCITGGIQPDALSDVVDCSREDGFSARVLFSWPDPVPNGNWNEDAVIKDLDFRSMCCEQFSDLGISKAPITFSPEAKECWIEWVNKHRAETPLDNLQPTWSKAEGHCLRLTLVLHLARFYDNATKSKQIDVPSIEGGIKLIEYFKSHAGRVYSHVALSSDDGKVAKALRWIKKQGGVATARVAHMNGFTRNSDEAKQLFHLLSELGHGTVSEGKQGNVTFTLRREGAST